MSVTAESILIKISSPLGVASGVNMNTFSLRGAFQNKYACLVCWIL